MTKEIRCAARCGAAPVIETPVPLCALHGLEVVAQVIPEMMSGAIGAARREVAARRSPRLASVAAPPGAVSPAGRGGGVLPEEARRLAGERLIALRGAGVERITLAHLNDLPGLVGRSRPWIYTWLGTLVKRGDLVPDPRGGKAGWRFAA